MSNMIFNSTEVLAGALVGLYRKVIDKKEGRKNLEEAVAIVIVGRLARAWRDSGMTWQAVPFEQQQLFYAAILNIVRDAMMGSNKLTLESGIEDALEVDLALVAGNMLAKAMSLTW